MRNVILYGNGLYYKEKIDEIRELEALGELNVLGVSSRTIPRDDSPDGWPVIRREDIPKTSFDYIVLMIRDSQDEILSELASELEIPGTKIIPCDVMEIHGVTLPEYMSALESKETVLAAAAPRGSAGSCPQPDSCSGQAVNSLYRKETEMIKPDKRKVSVIIPVYNVEKYLPDCLDSILDQTLRDIEVICIDDASPDGCPRILDDYAAKDPRIRVLHLSENHQQGYGRNRGLEMAFGKYVYFLDSDDMITEDALERLYDLAERDRLDGIFFDSRVIYESEKLAKQDTWYNPGRNGTYENRIFTGKDLYDTFAAQDDWTVFVQRQFWNREYLLENEILFPEETEHEDEFFSFKAILLANRVRYIPEPFFIHRFRDNSVMTRPKNAKDFHGYFRCYYLMTELLGKTGLKGKYLEKNLAHKYEWMIMTFPLFCEREDYKAWFRTEEERMLYRFFAASQTSEMFNARNVRRLIGNLPPYRNIWIYGAGIVGKRAFKALIYLGWRVEGFLVTDMKGNPDTLFDRPVRAVDEVEPDENRYVIVAVSKRYRKDVIRNLESRGWQYDVYFSAVHR